MANDFVRYFYQQPPVTRYMLLTIVSLALATRFQIISPYYLINDWTSVFKRFQIWRPFTAFFLVLTPEAMMFLLQLVMFYQTSTNVELNCFAGVTADYVFFLSVVGAFILVACWFLQISLYYGPLTMAMSYIMSQESPDSPVSLQVFQVKAKYIPAINAGISLFNGGIPGLLSAMAGYAAGHFFLFLRTIWPTHGGKRYLETPQIYKNWFPHRSHSAGFTVFSGPVRTNRDEAAVAAPATSAPNTGASSGFSRMFRGDSAFQGRGHRLDS